MPQVLLANPIELPQINVQRSLQSLAAFQGERLPDALSVDQWISRFSQYVSLKVEQGVTRYDFDDQAAGAAGASDFGILAKMSCAAYNSQPEDRRRHGPGLGLPQVEELRPAAGGEQARYTAYWWGYTIWCNHVL